MSSEVETINKGGEPWLIFSTVPCNEGLRVRVKAHQNVEEFIRVAANGKAIDAFSYGRRWTSIPNAVTPLEAYYLDRDIVAPAYSLSPVGSSLAINWAAGMDSWPTNLAFLRLKGVSEGSGVEFISKDVFSIEFRRKLRAAVGSSFRQFVGDHLRPTKITLIVTGQEL